MKMESINFPLILLCSTSLSLIITFLVSHIFIFKMFIEYNYLAILTVSSFHVIYAAQSLINEVVELIAVSDKSLNQ